MRPRWVVALLVLTAGGVTAAASVSSDVRSFLGDGVDTVIGWTTELRDIADSLPETEVQVRSVEGDSASLLIVIGEDEASAFALVAAGPEAEPTLVVLPSEMLVSVPGFGEYRVVDALIFDGPELVELAVTNHFGVRIDSVVAIPSSAVAEAVATDVTVDLAAPFIVDTGRDMTRQLPEGESVIGAAALQELLVFPGGNPFDRVQRQGAAWRALLQAVADDPRVADRLIGEAGGEAAADLLITVSADEETIVASIPVESADTVRDSHAVIPVAGRIDEFVATRLGHLILRPEGRPNIEVLNGNGRIGSTRAVAEILIREGFRLIRTDNAARFDYPDTLVIAQGPRAESIAREIVLLLGKGLLFLEEEAPSGVVDVSIIVGVDVPTGEG